MIAFTEPQLNAWLAMFIWPLARVLGLITAMPIFGNPSVPMRVRVGLGVFITLAVAPTLEGLPEAGVASPAGLLILAQQVAIGLGMGYAVRIVFAAVETAGEVAGLQMGLGFATFFDPQNSSQTPVVGQYLEVLAALAFLAINGHLMVIAALAESFRVLPVGLLLGSGAALRGIVEWGAQIFGFGVLMALPLMATLLVTNIAMGVLTRAAPQLNLFAVGFPATLLIGLIAMGIALPSLAPVMESAFRQAIEVMLQLGGG